jgi:hypothetical protein
MLDRTNWHRRHDGLDQFISWLEAQPENTYEWDDCEDCLFARYASTLGVQLGEAWHSLHLDGRIAMAIYTQIGAGDHGGRQSYADALTRAKYVARAIDAGHRDPECRLKRIHGTSSPERDSTSKQIKQSFSL